MREGGTEKVALWIEVNGQGHHALVDPRQRLSDFLREHLGLREAPGACKHGDCGSCVVHLNHMLTRSCQVAVADVLHASITTIEGLAGVREFALLQQAFAQSGVATCPVCRPGTMLGLVTLLQRTAAPDVSAIRRAVCQFPCECGVQDAEVAVVEALVSRRLGGET